MTFKTSIKQDWAIDQIVNLGFIKGLVVKEKVGTPGDYRPDGYVLWQAATNRWYSFQPHYGICRHDTAVEARESF